MRLVAYSVPLLASVRNRRYVGLDKDASIADVAVSFYCSKLLTKKTLVNATADPTNEST